MAGYRWVDSHNRAPFPPNAVEGGRDTDGSPIYVGLASYQGDELPVKIVPNRGTAYVSHNGKEIAISNYRVLVRQDFHWVRSSGGNVPPNAVPVGRTSSGETLYAGRAHHNRGLIVGKVHPSHGVVYIPYGGKEHGYRDYEVLVYN